MFSIRQHKRQSVCNDSAIIVTVYIDDQQRTLSVLLIGESGVGKSTWINAFANYCQFVSLEDAVKAGGYFPIPFNFTMSDPRTEEQIIISSEGKLLASTQITKAGESVTKNPNEYTFYHGNTVINFIDTPGLLDTDDVGTSTHDRDKQHVDNILKLLSCYHEIHAIFILMKANVTRLSAAFQYTLTEIFKRLDESACNNVIFIFTNAASSNFKTDETRLILYRFLNENNLPIALPPEKPTIYCFESDTVKYLAKCKNKIHQSKDDDEDAQRSWQRSVKAGKEMLGYICSLQPHSLEVMMSINNATNTVSMLSKLVMDTMMCIFKDVNDMTDRKNEAERLKKKITSNPKNFASDKLKELLHITETKLVHEPLGYVNVVCESPRCTTIEAGHVVYPQVCCEKCTRSYLYMYFCSQMNWRGCCTVCECKKNLHTWRTTKTKVVSETVYRPGVIAQVVESNEALKQIKEGISQFEYQVKECLKETQQMIEICAQLNAFARQNALVVGSQTEDELLTRLENRLQTFARPNTRRQFKDLEKMKSRYKQEMSLAIYRSYSVEDVTKLRKQLYRLPMKGPEIMTAVQQDEISRQQIIQESKKSKKNITIRGVSAIGKLFLSESVL